jgi:hypothetical protein
MFRQLLPQTRATLASPTPHHVRRVPGSPARVHPSDGFGASDGFGSLPDRGRVYFLSREPRTPSPHRGGGRRTDEPVVLTRSPSHRGSPSPTRTGNAVPRKIRVAPAPLAGPSDAPVTVEDGVAGASGTSGTSAGVNYGGGVSEAGSRRDVGAATVAGAASSSSAHGVKSPPGPSEHASDRPRNNNLRSVSDD